jgi:hypothetical protein
MKVVSVADKLLEGMYVPSTDSGRYAAGSDVIANAITVSPILVDPMGVHRSEAAAARLVAAALATYETAVEGIPVAVAIERPEADRAGEAWRCRIRVIRGTGRRELSQVVGVSAEAVLREAIELAATRLGIAGADLLGEASVGIAAAAPSNTARAARPVRREGWSA